MLHAAFDEKSDKLVTVKHCSGGEIKVEDSVHIYKKVASVTENWSDMNAAVLHAPYPPIRLCKFFEKAVTGPYKVKHYFKRCGDFDKLIKDIVYDIEADKKRQLRHMAL